MSGSDEDAVLSLLNSRPVVDGSPRDLLLDPAQAADVVRAFGGRADEGEALHLRRVRDALQAAVRSGVVGPELDEVLRDVSWRALPVGPDGLQWQLTGPEDVLPAARAVVAWADLTARRPGRLRPCGNDECLRFLIDRTKGNSARWCSMAVCGNRMKARRHQSRKSSAMASRTPSRG